MSSVDKGSDKRNSTNAAQRVAEPAARVAKSARSGQKKDRTDKCRPDKARTNNARTNNEKKNQLAENAAENTSTKLVAQDLTQPEHYINRELSFLEFNTRVLALARDANIPLLVYLKQ